LIGISCINQCYINKALLLICVALNARDTSVVNLAAAYSMIKVKWESHERRFVDIIGPDKNPFPQKIIYLIDAR
jgi:hypothetical protein